jgi:hypothetical protein
MTYEITTGGRRAGKSKVGKLIMLGATAMIPTVQKSVKRVNEAAKKIGEGAIKSHGSCEKLVEEMKAYKFTQKQHDDLKASRLPGSFKFRSRR